MTGSLISVLIAGSLLLLAARMRIKDQAWRDRNRKTYLLRFPADLPTEQVIHWLYSLSGVHGRGSQLASRPAIAFEMWADERGITHRLKVPWQQEKYILGQLQTLVPGVSVAIEDYPPGVEFQAAIELAETNKRNTLRIPSPQALSASLLASVQPLREGEVVLWQLVVAPVVTGRKPSRAETHSTGSEFLNLLFGFKPEDGDDLTDRRAKLDEPNLVGIARAAARADTEKKARFLMENVTRALSSTRNSDNYWRRRLVSTEAVLGAVRHAAFPLWTPVQLSATELASLIAWPLGQPHVVGLPQSRSRQLPATEAIPRVGRIIALSNFPGAERPLAITPVDSCKHLHVVGPTGVGKTTLLSNLIAQDMQAGRGVILIESKGDLFQSALDRVPKERLNDVVVLDVTDTAYPVGFNILQGKPQVVASDIQRLFEHLYPQDTRGVRVRQGMYHAILTLMSSKNAEAPMTFADIGPLCVPRADQVGFSDNLIRGVAGHEELAIFWQEMENLKRDQRAMYFGPIMDRIWQLNSRTSIRNIIGQSKSTIDLHDIIKNKKILLVNLGRATEGKDTAGLVGSLLLNAIWSVIQSGAADPEDPTFLFIDEFQDFLNLPISPQDMFAQARSLGLSMTVAHQFLGQLNRELQEAVLSNARSKVVFQTSADDARAFAREFGKSVTDHDFMHQRKYEVIARLASGDGVSSPITGVTKPEAPRTGQANEVRRRSRLRYARPVAEVEADIKNRRNLQDKKTRKRPTLGPRERS